MCGLRLAWQQVPEVRRAPDGHAFYTGIERCGSVWECPVCASIIQERRAAELRVIGERHRQNGGELYLATLTLTHQAGDPLRPLRRRVAHSWRRVQGGRAWLGVVADFGLAWWVRALEVTEGPHGWHPHLHVLIGTRAPLEERAERGLLAFLRARWGDEIVRSGWPRPSHEHGVTLVRCTREDYVAKLVRELVAGRKGGRPAPDGARRRTPWEILEDVADYERPADVARWREYAEEMHGARQLTWGGELKNPAARAAAGVPDQTDLELVDAEDYQAAETLYTFGAKSWRYIARRPDLQAGILDDAENYPDPVDAREAIWRRCRAALGRSWIPF
jgi:hypothetical protein